MKKRIVSFILVLAIVTLTFVPIAKATSNRLLSLGSRGSDVKILQQRLNSLGYNSGAVDGIFGTRTYNGVKVFQGKHGLAVDGIVGENTRNKLFSSQIKPPTGGIRDVPITGLLRKGSRGSQVTTLQNRLNQLGFNVGKADGIFGTRTYNGVKVFQGKHGLAVDGIVGKNTIDKLYPKSELKPKPEPAPKPVPEFEQMYRVRKSWSDPRSQIGAFRNLDGAKKLADQNPGYKVFDSSGKIVYENNPRPNPDPKPEIPVGSVSILSETKSNIKQMQAWARSKNATETFVNLAPIYFDIAIKIGVNPEGAYCQAAYETGFGRFGGVIDETYNNPCGLKTSIGGDNDDPDAHKRFKDWNEGITAHIDHLALYAGASGYPKASSPDPRHFEWLTGRATTFRSLGGEGKWAPNENYGIRLGNLLNELYNMQDK